MTGQPRVGDDVYIPSSRYLSHGRDDFAGGLCRIVKVVDEGHGLFVEVEEHPGSQYGWAYLQEHQDVWHERFGDRRGRPDPDLRPEFNEDWN
jgi:hypothetical protein